MAAISLAVGAVRSLVAHVEVGTSTAALILLGASVIVLPPLAIAKRRVASRLGSGALRADALLTGAAAVLAGVSPSASSSRRPPGSGRPTPSALVVAALVAREGMASVRLATGAPAT